jgi:hypothetical protein
LVAVSGRPTHWLRNIDNVTILGGQYHPQVGGQLLVHFTKASLSRKVSCYFRLTPFLIGHLGTG